MRKPGVYHGRLSELFVLHAPNIEAINTSNFDVSTSLNKRTLCRSAYPYFVDATFFVRLYRFTFHWRSNRKSRVFLVALFSIYSSFVSIAWKILATSRMVIAELPYSVSCCTVALCNRFNAFNEGEFLRFLHSVLEKIENNVFCLVFRQEISRTGRSIEKYWAMIIIVISIHASMSSKLVRTTCTKNSKGEENERMLRYVAWKWKTRVSVSFWVTDVELCCGVLCLYIVSTCLIIQGVVWRRNCFIKFLWKGYPMFKLSQMNLVRRDRYLSG